MKKLIFALLITLFASCVKECELSHGFVALNPEVTTTYFLNGVEWKIVKGGEEKIYPLDEGKWNINDSLYTVIACETIEI